MARHLGAVRQFALGENRHDFIVVLDAFRIHTAQIARWDNLFEHPVFTIDEIERRWLRHCPLDHVIRNQRGVLNRDTQLFFRFIRQLLKLVHPGSCDAQGNRVRCMHGRSADQRRPCHSSRGLEKTATR